MTVAATRPPSTTPAGQPPPGSAPSAPEPFPWLVPSPSAPAAGPEAGASGPALSPYLLHPLADGCALLVLDDAVVLPLQRRPGPSAHTVAVDLALRSSAVVELAVARADGLVQPADGRLWQELRDRLTGSATHLTALHVLPAELPDRSVRGR